MLASVRGHTDVVQLLLSSRARVDLQDTVVRHNIIIIVEPLLKHTDTLVNQEITLGLAENENSHLYWKHRTNLYEKPLWNMYLALPVIDEHSSFVLPKCQVY